MSTKEGPRAYYANEAVRDDGWYWVFYRGDWYPLLYGIYTTEAIEEAYFNEHPDADTSVPVWGYGWQRPDDESGDLYEETEIDEVGPRIIPPSANVPVHLIPNPLPDYGAERCGHNFQPMGCPYKFCGYRDTLKVLQELTDSLKPKLKAPDSTVLQHS